MSVPPTAVQDEQIHYPDSDGQPMSDNTRQFDWIQKLSGNLMALFRDRPDVFVKGNQNWYPVKGHPEICAAPDVYAVFGRPKGHRPSWKQWEEDNVPMTVVIEVRSLGNTDQDMADKQAFYDDYGVEEYYVYDPADNSLQVFRRKGASLLRVRDVNGYVSPRLGIRFDLSGPELVVRYPNGDPFMPFEELYANLEGMREDFSELREQLLGVREDLETARRRADDEKRRADDEKRRADDEKRRADELTGRMLRLKELSRKARLGQASGEEILELERLEAE